MILSDATIREYIKAGTLAIEPLEDSFIQPASVDVRVDSQFRVFPRNHRNACIDPRVEQANLTELVDLKESGDEFFVLHPDSFALGSTLERVAIPNDLVARIEGKSSLGRLGLLIHSTAGFIDPGFRGTITLELANVSGLPIKIYPGMKIGQVSFSRLTTPAERPYGHAGLGSKYLDQRGPQESQYHRNFTPAQ